jgi:DNA-binding transcriptional LysR family regulator
LDLNQLRAFDALMRERHVTRAAFRLGIGQSSMSFLLGKLRELLQDELLIRTGSGLVPTERALELWPRVQEAIGVVERVFEQPAVFDPSLAKMTFRMIVVDYIDYMLLPRVARRLRQEAPGVSLHVLQTRPHQFGEMLAAGDLDLVLSYFPNPPDYLQARRLFSDRFVGMCATGHPVLQATLDPASFCALPHITIEPDSAQIYNVQINEALEPFGLQRDVRMVKPSFLTLPFILETTDMVASMPARLARRMSSMAQVSLFDIPLELPTFDVRMLWHPRTSNSAAHEWLRSLILSCASEDQALGRSPKERA